MKSLIAAILTLLLCVSLAHAGGNDKGRQAYGPFTIDTANTCYPSDNGFEAKYLDGDIISIYLWSIGAGTLSVTPQITGFTLAEDPSNLSWISLNPRDDSNSSDSIVGPIERMRFCTTTCTGNCTAKIKVIGRVHP